MIAALKNLWLDATFNTKIPVRNMVTISNALVPRDVLSMNPVNPIKPEIHKWLRANVQGAYCFCNDGTEYGWFAFAHEIIIILGFSRMEDAILFKLTFG
jgi:hypothetical protein